MYSVGQVKPEADFFPRESVRCLIVSINTAHWAVACNTLTEGQQAGRGDMHRRHRGTVVGTRWYRGRSGKVDGAGPPLTGSAGVSLPDRPTLLQGGAFGSPRLCTGQVSQALAPAGPLVHIVTQGPGEWAAFPEPALYSWGLG